MLVIVYRIYTSIIPGCNCNMLLYFGNKWKVWIYSKYFGVISKLYPYGLKQFVASHKYMTVKLAYIEYIHCIHSTFSNMQRSLLGVLDLYRHKGM